MLGVAGQWAVIFTTKHSLTTEGYQEMAEHMEALVAGCDGFLGLESARGGDGVGITVSYWDSEEAITAWGANAEHLQAQEQGKSQWYDRYSLRVAQISRAYQFGQTER